MRHWILDIIFDFSKRYGGALLLLAGTGLATVPLEKPAWNYVRTTMPELSAESLSGTAGTGVILGTVGGFRTVLADIAWLRAYHFWSERELQNCESLMALARTLDPQNYFFWENSINYVAFDFPSWIIAARGGARVSEKVQSEIHRKAYESALEIIRRMGKRFPGEGKVFALAAQVTMIKTSLIYGKPDFDRALSFYKKAIESRRTPWFCFLSYVNIVRLHFPERIPATREYFEKMRERTQNRSRKQIISEALEELELPLDPTND